MFRQSIIRIIKFLKGIQRVEKESEKEKKSEIIIKGAKFVLIVLMRGIIVNFS